MPAVRGPTLSTHSPRTDVVMPSTTAAAEKTGRSSVWVQSLGAAAMTPDHDDRCARVVRVNFDCVASYCSEMSNASCQCIAISTRKQNPASQIHFHN
mmetsp:Transcript_301/g.573  ORF Transcript_301/g.573 Transcript_301/m.573 type:complete len:97 (+) Transcript_301:1906-2196(+)